MSRLLELWQTTGIYQISFAQFAMIVVGLLLLYLALKKAGVPAEMHIYQRGQHGFGLGDDDAANASWPERCRDWLYELKCVRH